MRAFSTFATIQAMDSKTKARRRAVVHLVELAMRAEHEGLDGDDLEALDAATAVLDAHRGRVELAQARSEITFLVERVLAPLYEEVQAAPGMTVEMVEAELVKRASRCGYDLSREALDDLVLLPDEINGKGPIKAAAEAMGAVLRRDERTILRWKAGSDRFPMNMHGRSGTRAANVLLHLAGLLRIEAAEDGKEALVSRLTAVIQKITEPPPLAPPPLPHPPGLFPPSEDIPD